MRLTIICMLMALLSASCSKQKTKFRIGVSQCSYDSWRTKQNNEILNSATL